MSTSHNRFLELAAATIDFELSPVERATLDRHLATCTTCRMAADVLRADARVIAALPLLPAPALRSGVVFGSSLQRGSRPSTVRFLAIAAVILVSAVLGAGVVLQPTPSRSTPPSSPSPSAPAAPTRLPTWNPTAAMH